MHTPANLVTVLTFATTLLSLPVSFLLPKPCSARRSPDDRHRSSWRQAQADGKQVSVDSHRTQSHRLQSSKARHELSSLHLSGVHQEVRYSPLYKRSPARSPPSREQLNSPYSSDGSFTIVHREHSDAENGLEAWSQHGQKRKSHALDTFDRHVKSFTRGPSRHHSPQQHSRQHEYQHEQEQEALRTVSADSPRQEFPKLIRFSMNGRYGTTSTSALMSSASTLIFGWTRTWTVSSADRPVSWSATGSSP